MSVPVHLHRRFVLEVSGADAAQFLHGLLSNSMPDSDELRYCALLTPQGKILSDLFVCRSAGAFLLDAPLSQREALPLRLGLYRLQASVEIRERPDLGVFVGGPQEQYADPRHAAMPHRCIARPSGSESKDLADYELTRIRHCLPEEDVDFAAGQIFPADINMDIFSGIDFTKGCFIGQEVVSRMKRKTVARRRSLALRFAGAAPAPGAIVTSGNGDNIGVISSISGEYALARLRIDRMTEQNDTALEAGGVAAKCAISTELATAISW